MTQSFAKSAFCIKSGMAACSSLIVLPSSSQNLTDGVRYALSQLQMSHLTLKDQQLQAIYAVYSGKDVFVFCQLVSVRAYVIKYSPSCLTISLVLLADRRNT